MSEVVTGRTKVLIKKHGINVSETVRSALEQEIRRREAQELVEKVRVLKRLLKKIPDDELVRAVRESRDKR